MKNKIIEQLKYFNGVSFNEENHVYKLKDYQFGVSVTQLIESYANKFNAEEIASKIAIRDNKNISEILKQWKSENQEACLKGSKIHVEAQNIWKGINTPLDMEKFSTGLKKAINNGIKQAKQFYEDYRKIYDMLYDEFIVWSKEYDIAGSIDGIMYNKLTGQCCILDFKTNKKLEFSSKYKKKMLIPLNKLDDCNGQHYFIQLSIYKYLIEKYTNIKIDELFIVYFDTSKENYEIIEVPYLKNEVEKILENRRCESMNSVGVLIMGGSGTGKSTSLRNLPAEETAIINVTNKPMPFKNKNGIKIVNCNNYEQMIKAIIGTKKRIVVVDDSSYMMTFENFDKATNKGYDKFTTMAVNYYDLITTPQKCDGEKIVYFIMHEEISDDLIARPKTIGKMLSQQLVIEGLFTVVLRSMLKNGEYVFQTHNDGTSVCKSPMDMFEEDFIPNDLLEVDKILREYYDFKPITEKLNKEENKETK